MVKIFKNLNLKSETSCLSCQGFDSVTSFIFHYCLNETCFSYLFVSAGSEDSKKPTRKFSVKKTIKLNKLKNKGKHWVCRLSYISFLSLPDAMYLIMEVTNMLLVKQATRRKARKLVAKKYLLIRCWNDQTWSVSIGFHLVTFSNPIVFLLLSLFF